MQRQSRRALLARTTLAELQNRYSTDVVGSNPRLGTNYIDARVKRVREHTIRACMAAVGNCSARSRLRVGKALRARLEAEVAELRDRLEQERGQRGLRAVPSPPAMIA